MIRAILFGAVYLVVNLVGFYLIRISGFFLVPVLVVDMLLLFYAARTSRPQPKKSNELTFEGNPGMCVPPNMEGIDPTGYQGMHEVKEDLLSEAIFSKLTNETQEIDISEERKNA